MFHLFSSLFDLRCLILVLEQSRVEIAVMLNELAYMKYEASKNPSLKESVLLKQRNVATAFSLVEKIIKLISDVGENQGTLLHLDVRHLLGYEFHLLGETLLLTVG